MEDQEVRASGFATGLSSDDGAASISTLRASIPDAAKLRIWWIPQVPMKSFEVDVPDLAAADLLLETLADYDAFQYENNVKPDYCNAGGLLMLENGEWVDWYDDDLNMEFDEWREAHGRRSASAIEARRAATTGAVHESATPKGDAHA